MWWTGLPGFDAPAPNRQLADRGVAVACAARLNPFDPGDGENGTPATEKTVSAFADWLADADGAADAAARRLALCLACDQVVPESTTRDRVIGTARWLHRLLIRPGTT